MVYLKSELSSWHDFNAKHLSKKELDSSFV